MTDIKLVPLAQLLSSGRNENTSGDRNNFYTIIWVKEGSPTHKIDFSPVSMSAGEFMFVGQSRLLQLDPTPNYDGTALCFTDEFFCRTSGDIKFMRNNIAFDLLKSPCICLNMGNKYPVEHIISFIKNELDCNKDIINRDEVIRMQIRTLMLLAEREIKSNNNLLINLVRFEDTRIFNQLTEKHFTQITSVSEYARLMSIPEKRLIRSVKEAMGCHPKEIIKHRRLIEAKRLLAYCSISIKEIAIRLGFSELTNFSKYFRTYTSKTPLEFRREFNPPQY